MRCSDFFILQRYKFNSNIPVIISQKLFFAFFLKKLAFCCNILCYLYVLIVETTFLTTNQYLNHEEIFSFSSCGND